MEKMGISVQTSGIKVEQGKYYLVNLNADPSLNELLVYYLKVNTSVLYVIFAIHILENLLRLFLKFIYVIRIQYWLAALMLQKNKIFNCWDLELCLNIVS